MARTEFQGPFLGFTYNGRHSSDLGIVRINTGNRAEMPLSPSFKDSTAEVPGGKGLYYFNTQVQQRQFTINFAYDDLDEAGVHELRKWLDPTQQGELIFDEEPYKAYTVKPNTQPKLSYLVFDREITTEDPERGEDDPPVVYLPSIVKSSGRIYKGEGAIGLTAYYPYARAPYKTIGDYVDGEQSGGFGNKEEWVPAAGIPTDAQLGSNIQNANSAFLFNPGDIISPLNFELKISKLDANAKYIGIEIPMGNDSNPKYYLYLDASKLELNTWDEEKQEGNYIYYIINSELQLIEKVNNNVKIPRNDLIIAGTFLYVEPCEFSYKDNKITAVEMIKLNLTDSVKANSQTAFTAENFEFDYLYL